MTNPSLNRNCVPHELEPEHLPQGEHEILAGYREAEPPTQIMEDLKAFARIATECKEKKEVLKRLEVVRDAIEARLIETMPMAGLQSASVLGATVYQSSQHWASAIGGENEKQTLGLILQDLGHDGLVQPSVNGSRLSSLIREMGQDEDGQFDVDNLPVELRQRIVCPDVDDPDEEREIPPLIKLTCQRRVKLRGRVNE
jgi:hypothetical protein